MTEAKKESQIGDEMEDGTIYAGFLKGRPLYATPEDAPLISRGTLQNLHYRFNEAAEYAEQLNAQMYLGKKDWRLPTVGELNVLFNNRAAIGGFEEGWYLSSELDGTSDVVAQRFSDGNQNICDRYDGLSLRCVRG